MKYNVKSEMIFPNHSRRYDVHIMKGNNVEMFTSVPYYGEDQRIRLTAGQEIKISYYFGQFAYVFDVKFKGSVFENERHPVTYSQEQVEYFHFEITGVEIEKNARKEQRRNVDLEGVLLSEFGTCLVRIVDLSDSGAKIQCTDVLPCNVIDVFYEENTQKLAFHGEVLWSRVEDEFVYYGIRFL